MENKLDILKNGCKKYNIMLTNVQEQQFLSYYEMLIEKNKVMNLTAITDFNDVMIKHFVDSLSISKVIDMTTIENIIDIGTGAGFPGIPLKIAYPHLKITLLDSLNKRVRFLADVVTELELKNISAIHGRAEEYARQKEYRESYDLCVSRAVSNLATLSEYCIPYIAIGGYFIPYKSGKIDEEVKNADKAIKILGGKLNSVDKFQLLDTDIERSFVIVKKIKSTPGKYPRKAGLPSKEPIH